MPCGRESPWGCEPRLLHFFFRQSMAERLAEGIYTTAEKRAKLVNSTKRLIEAQRVSAASRRSRAAVRPGGCSSRSVGWRRRRSTRAWPTRCASAGRARRPHLVWARARLAGAARPRKPWMNHCFVHVHGVKHSGTGLGGSPRCGRGRMRRSRRDHPQPRGGGSAHAGRVALGARPRQVNVSAGRRDEHSTQPLRVPALLRLPTAAATKRLWENWAWHWDVNRTILVQKSPASRSCCSTGCCRALAPHRHAAPPVRHHSVHHPTSTPRSRGSSTGSPRGRTRCASSPRSTATPSFDTRRSCSTRAASPSSSGRG